MADLAMIVRKYRGALEQRRGFLLPEHRKILDDIEFCQADPNTAVRSYCAECDTEHTMLASCKNRHCPKCQFQDGERWCKKQIERLLPVTYFMVTFTVPAQLRQMMHKNQQEAYSALFEAVKNSLDVVADNPKYLGGQYGCLAILHTWARDLAYHPHIHCIIPGGAFDEKAKLWRKSSKSYLFHVESLSQIFKGKLFEALKKRKLIRHLPPDSFKRELVVNCKPVDKGETALQYLGRYIFRTAISNRKILKLEHNRVTFEYKESKSGLRKTRTMEAVDFLELYLTHALPQNFIKVRSYGLMHHSNSKLLDKIALLLNWKRPDPELEHNRPSNPCPKCGSPMYRVLLYLDRNGCRRSKNISEKVPEPP